MKEIDICEVRTIQLEILNHINIFCNTHNIKYFLCGGSMLGAIRHQGYIPWDDDIDIMMLRDDYEKFIQLYKQKDNSYFRLRYFKNENDMPFPFVKIEDSRTILRENVENTIEMGINIDLFPIDTIPEDEKLQKKMFNRYKIYRQLLDLKQVSIRKGRSFWKNCVLFVSHIALRLLPLHALIHKIENNAKQYSNTKSNLCGIVVWGYGLREVNAKSNWDNVLRTKFETISAPIPNGYDAYLTAVYGDYMQLPPEEKRITHHDFKAYWLNNK